MVFFMRLVLAALVLGLVGVLARGLVFLLIIGIVLFIADLAYLALAALRSVPHAVTPPGVPAQASSGMEFSRAASLSVSVRQGHVVHALQPALSRL